MQDTLNVAPLGAGRDLGPGVPCLPSWNWGSAVSGSICGSGTPEGTQEVDARPEPGVARLLCQAGRWTPLCACRRGRWRRCGARSLLTPAGASAARVPSLTGENGHAEGKSLARGHRSTEWRQVSARGAGAQGRGPRTRAGGLLTVPFASGTGGSRQPARRCRSCFRRPRVRHGFTSQEAPTRSPALGPLELRPRQLPRVTLGARKGVRASAALCQYTCLHVSVPSGQSGRHRARVGNLQDWVFWRRRWGERRQPAPRSGPQARGLCAFYKSMT